MIVADDECYYHQGDAVSAWMMNLVAEEKAARKKEKISNFDLKSIIGMIKQQQMDGASEIYSDVLRYIEMH